MGHVKFDQEVFLRSPLPPWAPPQMGFSAVLSSCDSGDFVLRNSSGGEMACLSTEGVEEADKTVLRLAGRVQHELYEQIAELAYGHAEWPLMLFANSLGMPIAQFTIGVRLAKNDPGGEK